MIERKFGHHIEDGKLETYVPTLLNWFPHIFPVLTSVYPTMQQQKKSHSILLYPIKMRDILSSKVFKKNITVKAEMVRKIC